MKILKQIAYYFSVYRKYIGRRLYPVFGLSALAAVAEGFGIAMLLPLIGAAGVGMGDQAMTPSGVTLFLQRILDALGIGTSLIGILVFIAAVFLLKGTIVFSAHAYHCYLQSQLMHEIKALMFDRLSTMDYGYYSQRNTGHFINVINARIDGLIDSFSSYRMFLSILIMTTVYFGTAFLIAWRFAIMAVAVGFILMMLFRGLNHRVHGLSRKAGLEEGTLNKFLVQTLQSFKYLASTAELEHLRAGVMRSIRKMARYMRQKRTADALTESISEPVAIFFVVLVILVQVTVLDAPLAPIFVALILFNRAMGSVMGMQKAWQQVLGKIGSLEIVEQEFAALEQHRERSGGKVLDAFSETMVFDHVHFAYHASPQEVLRDIVLTIPANTTVAFVGESGAGKSTLVDMLTLMLKPCRGEVRIDGIPGNELELRSWRRQVGYVAQETVVFDDTIANNITLWKEDYHPDSAAASRVKHAARQAYAHKFIERLPERYNTLVGERGVRLSGGQRQRLFLARELYKKPRLLILDEATSALDSESEEYIKQSIDALKGTMTVVIIAHRLSTIKRADYIYVMERGRIIEHGTYPDLANRPTGRFRQMVDFQKL